jgi:N-carbamoyl-L-amino-acid hydrolase
VSDTLPINAGRLWARHQAMAEIGATAEGGVDRPCLSPEDCTARALLAGWARARGFAVSVDPIGNLFITRAGRGAGPAILTGSHMDSQPSGGRFDGIYGVLAAFEVLEALEDHGIETAHPVELVAWTNEEGARYQPGCIGSMVYAGKRSLESFVEVTDREGIRFGDALASTLAALPDAAARDGVPRPRAYIEAHIEQGPVLEQAGAPIGIVSGIQGVRWFEITVIGASAHAGTTPRLFRQDALRTAIELMAALQEALSDPADRLRFTIGRVEVSPNVPNTIAGRVSFTVDLRHLDRGTLQHAAEWVQQICECAGGPCQISVDELFAADPCRFDPTIIDVIDRAASSLGLSRLSLPSGAFHDALFLADIVPTGMIFIPCAGGVSHHPSESATPEHVASGCRVLAQAIIELAG